MSSTSEEQKQTQFSYPDAVAKGMMLSARNLSVDNSDPSTGFEGEFRPPPGPREVPDVAGE